ncbi:hypothetical protein AAIH69_17370 [Paenibacillus sp. MABNS29]|nr:hypothetical protein [Paenibacillus polymyxa]MDY8095919.1 hypothetical protein [Paenibacillus polymyxa]WRL58251.1 hypothetical protein U3G77_08340 [Paenibacillus polymyxa]
MLTKEAFPMESFFFIHNETSVTVKNGNIIYCKRKNVKKGGFL